jgi:UDPglucose 6-dehydrogenase
LQLGFKPEGANQMKIAVAGIGYVGLSVAVLLAQHNEVMALTTTPPKSGYAQKQKIAY